MPCALGTRTRKYYIFARTRGSRRDCSSRNTPVFVHCRGPSRKTRRLERIVRVEEDSDWAFIDQLHGHHGLKNSSSDRNAQLAERLAEFVIKRLGKLGGCRSNKAGPSLPPRIAVQRELRNGQSAAFNLEQRPVHFALMVFEDAQVRAFLGHSHHHR